MFSCFLGFRVVSQEPDIPVMRGDLTIFSQVLRSELFDKHTADRCFLLSNKVRTKE